MNWVIGHTAWDLFANVWRTRDDREEIDFEVQRRALGCAGFVFRLLRHFTDCRLIGPRDLNERGVIPILPAYTSTICVTNLGTTFGVYSSPYGDVRKELERTHISKKDGVIVHDPTGKLVDGITEFLYDRGVKLVVVDADEVPKKTLPSWYYKCPTKAPNVLVGKGNGVELNDLFVENFFEGQNTVGCGDALIVGFFLGKIRGWEDLDALKLGVLFANCEANLGPWAEEFGGDFLVNMCTRELGAVPEVLEEFLGGSD